MDEKLIFTEEEKAMAQALWNELSEKLKTNIARSSARNAVILKEMDSVDDILYKVPEMF